MLLSAPTKRLSWLRGVPTRNRSWVCQSCQLKGKFQSGRKPFSSSGRLLQETSTGEKPYYVTTPIFYVNACKQDPPFWLEKSG